MTANGASELAEEQFKDSYPAVYNHLLKYKKELTNRNKAETGIRYEWYALQRWAASYWEDFFRPKIVWKRVGSLLRFCLDDKGFTTLDSTCFVTGDNLKYLVAFLNSTMGHYLLKDAPKTGTGDLLISVQAIEPLLIPRIDKNQEEYLNDLVDKIIDRDREGNAISSLCEEIDQLIFNLYQLSEDEIRIIKQQTKHNFAQ